MNTGMLSGALDEIMSVSSVIPDGINLVHCTHVPVVQVCYSRFLTEFTLLDPSTSHIREKIASLCVAVRICHKFHIGMGPICPLTLIHLVFQFILHASFEQSGGSIATNSANMVNVLLDKIHGKIK